MVKVVAASINTNIAYGYRCQVRKHQRSASLAFVRGIHRWQVDFPHKGPVTRKMFPFDDGIMDFTNQSTYAYCLNAHNKENIISLRPLTTLLCSESSYTEGLKSRKGSYGGFSYWRSVWRECPGDRVSVFRAVTCAGHQSTRQQAIISHDWGLT